MKQEWEHRTIKNEPYWIPNLGEGWELVCVCIIPDTFGGNNGAYFYFKRPKLV